MKISVIGTGYVGLVTGVSLAEIGHEVICVDTNVEKIEMLKKYKSPIYEPGIEKLIKSNFEAGRLYFELNSELNYDDCEIIYLAVGTPQAEDGTADLTYINQVIDDIRNRCRQDKIIVTKSTVPVGTNLQIKESLNKNNDVYFDVVSNPEFLREGSAVKDVFNPERIVLGSDSKEAIQKIVEVNHKFNAPAIQTNFESTEIIKYASNAFLATKISYANMISNLCEAAGADIHSVTKGMGLDHRIGDKFLQAGIGYGGSCFPKDTSALTKISDKYHVDSSIVKSAMKINEQQQIKLISYLDEIYTDVKDKKISLLGLAFKPETDDIRDAAAIKIIKKLLERQAKVHVFDPEAMNNIKQVFGEKIVYEETATSTLQGSEAALVITEWDAIKNIELAEFKSEMKRPLILDGRGIFLDAEEDSEIEYRTIGRKGAI